VKIVAITNQKGGCGKTTTAVNLGAALSAKGFRTLVVDLDPQGHATLGFGIDPESCGQTIYDVIVDSRVSLSRVLKPTKAGLLMAAPANVLLSGAESQLLQMTDRESILKARLETVQMFFDYCLIDCAPSLSLLTLNALTAADEIISPVQTHYYAIEGLKQVLETIDLVKDRWNPTVGLTGILLTLAERRTMLSQDVERQMREYFGDQVFRTVIHRNVRLAEAPSAGLPAVQFDPRCPGAREYIQLAEEITNEKIRLTQADCIHI
jgi:chromosome partitioning protein